MPSLKEWLTDLSQNCSVERLEDVESGIFKAKIKDDIYLISHADVSEK